MMSPAKSATNRIDQPTSGPRTCSGIDPIGAVLLTPVVRFGPPRNALRIKDEPIGGQDLAVAPEVAGRGKAEPPAVRCGNGGQQVPRVVTEIGCRDRGERGRASGGPEPGVQPEQESFELAEHRSDRADLP